MGGNQINEIDSNGFQGFENLEEIYFNQNKLTKIDSSSFQNLKKLKKLDLSCNYLKEIDANRFFDLVNLMIGKELSGFSFINSI
jgi:Leucine-rich repeat (LRR) protein